MTTYTAITNGEVAPEAPITSELLTRLRDNTLAIQEGDATAPNIVTAAITDGNITDAKLNTGAATGAGTTWVGKRMAGLSAGNLGTFVLARYAPSTGADTVTFGRSIAGSSLFPAGYYTTGLGAAATNTDAYGAALSGTWEAQGYVDTPAGALNAITLWLRVA